MIKRNLIRRVSQWGNNRRMRRVAVLLWIGMLVFDPWMVSRLIRSYAVLAMLPGISALTAMPSSAQRCAAPTANSTLADLDWP